ncbi:hypothetical protein HYPBUDRAFT_232888 [Hyphopichia burtonii NRRL Y-1933]|uniref:Uncharacterized protein n=1 Tax=Hyphopichia burtonii NRRL Y-1933 TaxID=984485 RepID=A0A1E4RC16_9ASCO|nr:hypothetical protein HYPBUDRAFT_232888 [Hyphopichia burtonii NRRL Y-1933]ODV64776.1 hypothetical protein HYPBUDRAFT_232888 [Hyphopichia burtonii NRRL Y-1933]
MSLVFLHCSLPWAFCFLLVSEAFLLQKGFLLQRFSFAKVFFCKDLLWLVRPLVKPLVKLWLLLSLVKLWFFVFCFFRRIFSFFFFCRIFFFFCHFLLLLASFGISVFFCFFFFNGESYLGAACDTCPDLLIVLLYVCCVCWL